MKTARIPAVIFGVMVVGYLVFLAGTASLLPPRIASHFDANGRPDGWSNRSTAVILHSIFGLVSPIVITTLCCLFRFIPVEKIKMPRRDYWFSPERRDETCTYLARQGLALGSLLIGLQALAWYQVVEANNAEVKQLPPTAFTFVLMAYGLVLVMWVLRLFRHFVQPPTEK
jgi:uncharacterized membrane protein